MAYPLSALYIIDVLLDMPAELVKRSSNVASHSLELTITATTLPPPAIQTPDATTTIDYGAHPVDVLSASLQLAVRAEPDASGAVVLRDDRSSAERVDEPILANTEGNAEDFGELLGYSGSHTPGSEGAEPVTPIPESPTSPNHTSLDATSDDLIREQKAAVIHELSLLFHFLEERACRSHAQTVWEKAWMEVRAQDQVEENVQQDMADETPVNEDVQQDNVGEALVEEEIQQDKADEAPAEEDVQQEEVHQRRKRRGGKRNTAWKNKRRQEKEDNERDPEAGSSGLR